MSGVGAAELTQFNRYSTGQSRPTVDQVQSPEIGAEVDPAGGQFRLTAELEELVGQRFLQPGSDDGESPELNVLTRALSLSTSASHPAPLPRRLAARGD
jgi:hypothetical protein